MNSNRNRFKIDSAAEGVEECAVTGETRRVGGGGGCGRGRDGTRRSRGGGRRMRRGRRCRGGEGYRGWDLKKRERRVFNFLI